MTTWGSKNAEGLFNIATRIAGFDGKELMLEIHKTQRDKTRNVNEATVLRAMQTVSDRYKGRKEE